MRATEKAKDGFKLYYQKNKKRLNEYRKLLYYRKHEHELEVRKLWREKNVTPLIKKEKELNCKCLICDKLFYRKKSQIIRNGGKYCSPKCHHNSMKERTILNCPICKKDYEVKKSYIKKNSANTCSTKCRGLNHRGEKSYNWSGGGVNRDRNTEEYKLWRTAVFERDNYMCVWCGDNVGHNLNADHIRSFSKYPESRFDLDNGRTLCISCHKKTPNYGKKAIKYEN